MNDTIIILGGSADIGQHLLQKFTSKGYNSGLSVFFFNRLFANG